MTLAKRIERLEAAHGGGRRLIAIAVRDGHTVEDRERALAEAGVVPKPADLLVLIRKAADEATARVLYTAPCA